MDTIANNVKKNLCLSALYPNGSHETIVQRIERIQKEKENAQER